MRRLVLLALRKRSNGYGTEILGSQATWPLRMAQAALADRGFEVLTAERAGTLPELRALLAGQPADDGPLPSTADGPDADHRIVWFSSGESGDAGGAEGWHATVATAADGLAGAGAGAADGEPRTLPALLTGLSERWRPADLWRSPYLDGAAATSEWAHVGLSLVADGADGAAVDRPADLLAAELAWLGARVDRDSAPAPLHGLSGSADRVHARLAAFAGLVTRAAATTSARTGAGADDVELTQPLRWSATLTADLVDQIGLADVADLVGAAGIAELTVTGVADAAAASRLLALADAATLRLDLRALSGGDVHRVAGRIGGLRVSLLVGRTADGLLPRELLGLAPGLISEQLEGAAHLQEISGRLGRWATGTHSAPVDGPTEIVLASAEHLAAVADPDGGLAGFGTLVFAPVDPAGTTSPGLVVGSLVRYTGELATAGDELVIGDDFFLQTFDYSSGGYLSLVGPTLLRITSEIDYAVFLEDADAARARGEFPEYLLHPFVQLADICALGNAHPCAGRQGGRLYVDAEGGVRPAPGGALLGQLAGTAARGGEGSRDRTWDGDAGDDPCLAAVVPVEVTRAARAERPWLSRFLWGLDALRRARAEGLKKPTVSGFGGRLVEGLEGLAAVEAPDAPLLLGDRSGALLVSPRDMRVFRITRDAAVLVEILLLVGPGERAVELAGAHTGVAASAVRDGFASIIATFARSGVDLTSHGSGTIPAPASATAPASAGAVAVAAGNRR